MLTKPEINDLYRKRAGHYDVAVQLYRLLGFRMNPYRRQAIQSLELKPGDTVVDIACGTGANFPLLQERIGPNGKIIGVDFADAMLAKARQRVKSNQWRNVELVRSDAAEYPFPDEVDGVISTFAILYVPEFDDVIRNGSQSLAARAASWFSISNCPTAGYHVSLPSDSSSPGRGVSRGKWLPAIPGSP